MELREFLETLQKSRGNSNIGVRGDIKRMRFVITWDEELIDLENK